MVELLKRSDGRYWCRCGDIELSIERRSGGGLVLELITYEHGQEAPCQRGEENRDECNKQDCGYPRIRSCPFVREVEMVESMIRFKGEGIDSLMSQYRDWVNKGIDISGFEKVWPKEATDIAKAPMWRMVESDLG